MRDDRDDEFLTSETRMLDDEPEDAEADDSPANEKARRQDKAVRRVAYVLGGMLVLGIGGVFLGFPIWLLTILTGVPLAMVVMYFIGTVLFSLDQ